MMGNGIDDSSSDPRGVFFHLLQVNALEKGMNSTILFSAMRK